MKSWGKRKVFEVICIPYLMYVHWITKEAGYEWCYYKQTLSYCQHGCCGTWPQEECCDSETVKPEFLPILFVCVVFFVVTFFAVTCRTILQSRRKSNTRVAPARVINAAERDVLIPPPYSPPSIHLVQTPASRQLGSLQRQPRTGMHVRPCQTHPPPTQSPPAPKPVLKSPPKYEDLFPPPEEIL